MSVKQRVAVVAPPVIVTVMIPVFRLLADLFPDNWRIGWYLGLVLYWIICCGVLALVLIGKDSIRKLIRPQRLTREIIILLLIPLIGAGLYRLVPGMEYAKPQAWIFLLLLSTNPGNGFFEELLWRGVYLELFPKNRLFGFIWPSLWFALWHYAPGSIAPDGNVIGLMVGSGIMGSYLSFLARRTGTIWWTIIMHTIGGFIMIV